MNASIVTNEEDSAAMKQPIRKSIRLPKQLEPSVEFRISSYQQLRDSTHISSPVYTLHHSAWRLVVTPPEKSMESGELAFLRITVENVWEDAVTVSLQGCVWGLNEPEGEDAADVTVVGDHTVAVEDAFHLPITPFKLNGKADFLCRDVTYDMLKDTATLGIGLSVHVYGEPVVVDHASIIASNFPSLCFRDFTLGRDMGGILSTADFRGKHIADIEELSPDSLMLEPSRLGVVAGASATSLHSATSSSNVAPNLVLHDKTFSDIKLVTCSGDERTEIFAHKCILAARSPVFRRKFSRPMSNFQLAFTGNKYHFDDVHPAVARELVTFIYTDDIKSLALSQHAVPLLLAAAKYQVEGLVKVCERYLIENITPDVAAAYLQIATTWRLKELETASSYYIASHIDDVRAQDFKWGELSANQCRMLLELSSQTDLLWNWTTSMLPPNYIPSPTTKEEEKEMHEWRTHSSTGFAG